MSPDELVLEGVARVQLVGSLLRLLSSQPVALCDLCTLPATSSQLMYDHNKVFVRHYPTKEYPIKTAFLCRLSEFL